MEAPIRSIVNHLSDNFTFNSQTNEKIFSFDGETSQTADSRVLKLNMNSKLSGAKFRWNFQFERLDNTYLRLHVLLPLIYSSAEFQLREQELFRLVQAKDKEIEDFKSQGHKLSRSKHFFGIFLLTIFIINHIYLKSILRQKISPSKHLMKNSEKRY